MEMATAEGMVTSLASGAFTGLVTDLSLFPIDTLKTRLQSKDGFRASGGFRGIYRGFFACMCGSIPNNASFWLAYEISKVHLPKYISSDASMHFVAGAVGEVVSISCRMPFEVVKQTAQASNTFTSSSAFTHVVRTDGVRGLYSGFFSTVYRDVPYTSMCMPIWEYLKTLVQRYNIKHYNGNGNVTALQSGVCGGFASGIAAAITTPMDVAKTRIILSCKSEHDYTENPFKIIYRIFRHEGLGRCFSGVVPRVVYMYIGGVLYLGVYDFAKSKCQILFSPVNDLL